MRDLQPAEGGPEVTLHQNAKTCPASRRLMCRRVVEHGWSRSPDGRSGPVGRHPRRTDPEREAVIAELRGQVRMSAVAIADALGMPERTARGVIARLGLRRLAPLVEPEPANRYGRPMPGELIHIDVNKLGRIGRPGHRVNGDRTTRSRGIGWEFVHVCVDDCTRRAYVEVLDDERKETVTAFLRRAVGWFAAHGVIIERLMTDNGSGYRSKLHRRACDALGIRHLFTRPYRPQTNGKNRALHPHPARRLGLPAPLRHQRPTHRRPGRVPDWLQHPAPAPVAQRPDGRECWSAPRATT